VAYDTVGRSERRIAEDVLDFAATPDGARIALVREVGRAYDLWLVDRDGAGLRQLTQDGNDRIEATPSWAPDGLSLVYAAADSSDTYTRQWPIWAEWCAVAEVRKFDLPTSTQTTLALGCDPSFSPDGRRIAYAAPPTAPEPGFVEASALTVNSVRLINRQGQNGWDFARARGAEVGAPAAGRLVYAPAWSPDGARVVYHRFIGNQVEVDINISEIGGSFEGKGQPLLDGAGWLLPARFAPDGRTLVVTEHNFGDPRGFGGYDSWSARIIRLEGSHEVALPSGTMTMLGTPVGDAPLSRAQQAAWSPDGSELAVQLPPSWQPGISEQEPLDPTGAERPGDIWRWRPGADPAELLVSGVDFASPIAWLPPVQSIVPAEGYRLALPHGWQPAATEFEERTAVAPDGLRAISAAPFASLAPEELAAQTVAGMFPAFVAPGGKDEAPIAWPDGSVYREFLGTTPDGIPVAGATRIVRAQSGATVVVIYRSTPERWPLERSLAQGLLARSGPTS
jgi:Tol biopolymer transport system component